MSRKKKSLALLATLLALLALLLMLYRLNFAQNSAAKDSEEIQPQNDTQDKPKGPILVVPENPLGIIGLMTAFAAGLGIFGITKKKE
jgi:hypothetical protein